MAMKPILQFHTKNEPPAKQVELTKDDPTWKTHPKPNKPVWQKKSQWPEPKRSETWVYPKSTRTQFDPKSKVTRTRNNQIPLFDPNWYNSNYPNPPNPVTHPNCNLYKQVWSFIFVIEEMKKIPCMYVWLISFSMYHGDSIRKYLLDRKIVP